jgi:hypothetical protein
MSDTKLAVMRMLENLLSPEYISGQLNNPEESTEYDIPDPFAQFLPPNDGLIIPNKGLLIEKKPTKVSKKKRITKKIVNELLNKITETQQKPAQQGFVPQDKPRLSPQLPFEPGEISNLREMIALRKDQDAGQRAFENLEKNLLPMAMGLQLLMGLSPIGARVTPRSSNLAPPVPMNKPNPIPAGPLNFPQNESIFPQINPVMPSSGLSPRGDAYKFTNKGGREFLRRFENSLTQKPGWVEEGTQNLIDQFNQVNMKRNSFGMKDLNARMNLQNLLEAGKNIQQSKYERAYTKELREDAKAKGFSSLKEYAEAQELGLLFGDDLNKEKYDIIKESLKKEKEMEMKLKQHLRNKNRLM